MTPDDPRHGAERGYSAHKRAGEKPCGACEKAKHRADKRRRVLGSSLSPLPADLHALVANTSLATLSNASGLAQCTLLNIRRRGESVRCTEATIEALRAVRIPTDVGTVRRVRALTRLGWSAPEIASAAGIPYSTVVRLRDHDDRTHLGRDALRYRVSRAYEELCMKRPAWTRWTSRLSSKAARHGWAPPLAWDDIDDPNEQPGTIKRSVGRPPRKEDVLQDFEWLTSQGVSDEHAAARVGVKLATIRDYQRQAVAA